MADTQTSSAARELAMVRWGAQRPVKLARELAERVGELPEIERVQLRAALDLAGRERQPC